MSYRKNALRTARSDGSKSFRKWTISDTSKDLQIIEHILSDAERFVNLHITGISFMDETDVKSYLIQLESFCNLSTKEDQRKTSIKYKLDRILHQYSHISMEISQETVNSSFDVNLLTNTNFLSNSNSSDSGITPDVIPETQKTKSFNEIMGKERRISLNEYSNELKLNKKRKLSQNNGKTNDFQNHLLEKNTQIQESPISFDNENNRKKTNLREEKESSSDAETMLFELDNMELNTDEIVLLEMSNSKSISPRCCRDNAYVTQMPSEEIYNDSTKENIFSIPLVSNLKSVQNENTSYNKSIKSKHHGTNFGRQYHNNLTNVSSSLISSASPDDSIISPPTSYTTKKVARDDFSSTIAGTYNAIDNTVITQPTLLIQSPTSNRDTLFSQLSNNSFVPTTNFGISTNLRDKSQSLKPIHSVCYKNGEKCQDYSSIVSQSYYSTNESSPTSAKVNTETILYNESPNDIEIPSQDSTINIKRSQQLNSHNPDTSKNIHKNSEIINIISETQSSSNELLSHQHFSDNVLLNHSSTDINVVYETKCHSVLPEDSQNDNSIFYYDLPNNFENPKQYSKSTLKKPRCIDSIQNSNKTDISDKRSNCNNNKNFIVLNKNKRNAESGCRHDKVVVMEDDGLPEDVYFSQLNNISQENLIENKIGFDFTQSKPSQHAHDVLNQTSSNVTRNNIQKQISSEIEKVVKPVDELHIVTIDTNRNGSSFQNAQLPAVNPNKKNLENIVLAKNLCLNFKLNFTEDIKKCTKIHRAKMQTRINEDVKIFNPFLCKANVEVVCDTINVGIRNEMYKKTLDIDMESLTELFADMVYKEMELAAVSKYQLHKKYTDAENVNV